MTNLRPLVSPYLPRGGRMAKASLTAAIAALMAASATAQEAQTPPQTDNNNYNREVRTRTWSIYAEGGTSWAMDVWYPNINARNSYKLAPAVGGGIDFNIKPWMRLGLEYVHSRYRREQSVAPITTNAMPAKVYGNYLMNFHNAKLGLGFNIMEMWPRRGAQWLNMYVGTGVGYCMARGNEYSLVMGATKTINGVTTPLGDGNINNTGQISISGVVTAHNEHSSFRKLYIPASLNIEADLSRQFTIGLKGEMDWLMNREGVAPKNLVFALATVRYNFVRSTAKMLRLQHEAAMDEANDRLNNMRQIADNAEAKANAADAEKARLQQELDELQRQLDDCNKSKRNVGAVAKVEHVVPFAHDKWKVTAAELVSLKAFAKQARGHKLGLTAEASTPGTNGYNQSLSERRLQSVMRALMAEGFKREDLKPTIAIGEQNGQPGAQGRIVTITVEE